jgi:hypothetical protein
VLLKEVTVDGIATGAITAVYRRWPRPRVRAGSTFRTSAGVVRIERVEPTTPARITERDACRAGHRSRASLLAELARYAGGRLYRISLGLAGPDPRIALRADARWTSAEIAAMASTIARFDAGRGPRATAILGRIAAQPGVRAADLAAHFGMATLPFKARVRRLKELGLTESLEVGYRLSPRGRAWLRRTAKSP